MGFGDELLSVLPELREMAEDRMRTTVALQFQVGTTPDPETDADVPVYETAFTTKARIKSPGRMVSQGEAGGRTSATTTRELHIPIDSPDPWADPRSAHGVTALVTEIAPSSDPTLLGIRVTLSGPAPGDQTTARRLQIEQVVS